MYNDMMNEIGFRIFFKDDNWEGWKAAEIETEKKFYRYDETKCKSYIEIFTKIIKIIECWLANKKCFNIIYEETVEPPYSADFHLEEDLDFIENYFPKGSIFLHSDVEVIRDDDDEEDEDNDYDDELPYEYTIMFSVDR
jgi:hypothetical protein